MVCGGGGGLTDAVLQETVIDSCVLDGDMGAQLFFKCVCEKQEDCVFLK